MCPQRLTLAVPKALATFNFLFHGYGYALEKDRKTGMKRMGIQQHPPGATGMPRFLVWLEYAPSCRSENLHASHPFLDHLNLSSPNSILHLSTCLPQIKNALPLHGGMKQRSDIGSDPSIPFRKSVYPVIRKIIARSSMFSMISRVLVSFMASRILPLIILS